MKGLPALANLVSYCLNFVNDRKCKYALRQVFPAIPARGFKQWPEVTLHAATAFHTVKSLRTAAESHVVLKQLSSASGVAKPAKKSVGGNWFLSPTIITCLPNAIESNPTEAKEVVKLIELHVREHPEKSLGVVTMNISQMELIEELLLVVSEQVRAFCSDESKFFLRNLETVQGDEMDRIILSLTYGKNASGQFSAAVLGPLNKSGGERRLNVAITRSRNGMTIVSSLKVADLEQTNAQSRGFNCLKDFLAELENTEQARTFGIGSKRFERKNDGVSNIVYCESPFEEQVVEFLENEGYDIECQ